ncbi:MAG: hypothetical protein R2827_14760 [Bdellovibrionales bacterium]
MESLLIIVFSAVVILLTSLLFLMFRKAQGQLQSLSDARESAARAEQAEAHLIAVNEKLNEEVLSLRERLKNLKLGPQVLPPKMKTSSLQLKKKSPFLRMRKRNFKMPLKVWPLKHSSPITANLDLAKSVFAKEQSEGKN